MRHEKYKTILLPACNLRHSGHCMSLQIHDAFRWTEHVAKFRRDIIIIWNRKDEESMNAMIFSCMGMTGGEARQAVVGVQELVS